MDGEVREDSTIPDYKSGPRYNSAVLEDALGRDIRDLTAFLIAQSERTGRPLAVHAYTDRVHFRQTFRELLKDVVPPQYEKAFEHLLERLEEITTPIFPADHPGAIIRVIFNAARAPIVDRPTPGSPTAYAEGNIDDSTLRHGVTQARTLRGVDPEMHDVPPGFAFLAEPAFEEPADRQEALNKQGGNLFMFNEKELNDMVALRLEQMRRLMRLTPELVSKGEKIEEEEPEPKESEEEEPEEEKAEGAEAETAEGESWQEQQRRQNEEFRKRQEEVERIKQAMERAVAAFEEVRRQNEELFDRQRDQAKEAREARERNDKATEDRNRANEQNADRQRESDERYRSAVESNLAALEAGGRELEENAKRLYEEMEANNALAEAIARLEATFGLIAEHEEEVARAPMAASELMVLAGEIMALRRLLDRRIGSEDLRARAFGDVQRGLGLGVELKRLAAAAALEAGEGPGAAEGAIEGRGETTWATEAAGAAAEIGGEGVVGTVAEAAVEGAVEAGQPTEGAVTEAIVEVTGTGEPAGEEAPAAEAPEVVVEPVAEAAVEQAPEAAAEDTSVEVPPEEIPEVVEPQAAGDGAASAPEAEPESEPQPSEETSHPLRDEIEEHIVDEAMETIQKPVETGEEVEGAPSLKAEPEPAEAKEVPGGKSGESPITDIEEIEPRAPDVGSEKRADVGPEAASPRPPEPDTGTEEPSDQRPPHPVRDEVERHMVQDVMAKTIQPVEPDTSATPAEAEKKTTEPSEPQKMRSAEEPSLFNRTKDRVETTLKAARRSKAKDTEVREMEVREAEADIKRAGRARKRTDAAATQPSYSGEGLRRLQEKTGPQARAEESAIKEPRRRRTKTEGMSGGSGRQTKQSVLEKAAANALRENLAGENDRRTVIEEARDMRPQQKWTKKPPAAAQSHLVKTTQRRSPAAKRTRVQKEERPNARAMEIKRPPLPPKQSALPDERKPLPKTTAMTKKKSRQIKQIKDIAKPHRPGTLEPAP